MKIQVMLGTALLAGLLAVQEAAAKTTPVSVYDSPGAALSESQKVERLIDFIRSLEGATFIRNGMEHNCKQAADHLQAKWKKHMNEIHSAQDFIAKLASTSGMTGIDYKIKFANGTVVTARETLMQELKRLEQE
jgi:hypothetical protein